MSDGHGDFIWYELVTTDVAAASAFYGSVIGWSAKDSGVPGVDYTLLMAGERGAAGAVALTDEVRAAGGRPGWIGYVAVRDVDATAAEIETRGGRIHRAPTDIPGVGRFAIAADPQGAVIALLTPTRDGGPPEPNAPGHAGWRELLASDWESAFAFYAERFGWTKGDTVDMGPMGTYQLVANVDADAPFGGMMTKPPSVPAPFWMYYFNIDDIKAGAERVRAAGGQVLNGPHEVPGGMWIVQCIDPQSALFALVAPR